MEGFGNTTTARGELSTAVTDVKLLDAMGEIYGDRVWPFYLGTLCPRPLFLAVVRINHLRRTASANPAATADAMDILADINSFDPENWAVGRGTQETKPHWAMLAGIYQSAVAVYCVRSLESVGVLAATTTTTNTTPPEVTALDASHYQRLLRLLRRAYEFPHFRHCAMWPLVVAGVRAVAGSPADRRFVEDKLVECSRAAGSALPLQAKEMLRRYWDSGKTGWDDCFDRSYVFCV